ncbi:AI-2E family transporter [Planosporangium thailandense]|uniref:AI-2E family transporter n=1 Tax=Planosporangium thailandense TaxID=765197 RepID=A0ABX0XV03_9ACTN|nr:AI-2E family transporter [Planosporangium thailandense]NJC69618.1 AI-2E family transporter [Planosporangium thailandense]
MTTSSARSPARTTLTVIGLVLLTAFVLGLVYEARRVLTWLVIAAFFAVALYPAVNWIDRHVGWCRRWLSTLLVFLLVFVILAGLTALFVLPLVNDVTRFADQVPALVHDTRAGRGPLGALVNRFHLRQYAEQHSGQIRAYLSNLGAPTLALIRGAVTAVVGAITVFVLAYLMVLEGPRVVDGVLGLLEPRRAERIHRVGRDCARTITGYITGNLLISVICGALTYAVLALLHVPFAGLIALFVAIADLIPLVGATLGAVVAALAGFFYSLTAGIVVVVFFIVYQQVENHLLQPVILARTVRLDPLTVLISILIFTELAGILGALLAIPIAGMIQIIAREVWSVRRQRRAAQPSGAPAPSAGSEPAPSAGSESAPSAGSEPPPGDGEARPVAEGAQPPGREAAPQVGQPGSRGG